MISTPLGSAEMTLDDNIVKYRSEIIGDPDKIFKWPRPKESCLYYLEYDYVADGKPHTLKFNLNPCPCEGDPESDEHQECLLFEKLPWCVSLAVEADFGLSQDYGLDYDGYWDERSLIIDIEPTTKSQTFRFAVAWARDEEGLDVAEWTYLIADPFMIVARRALSSRKESHP